MPINLETLTRIKTHDVFIETGSCQGSGIRNALSAGYSEVLSIECHQGYYDFCKNLFGNDSRVKLFFGDSSKDLHSMIQPYDKPVTFYLDAHYMFNDPNQDINNHPGYGYVPLVDELTQIKNHPIKTHTIIIDDISHLGNLEPRGDKPPTGVEATKAENLINFVLSINPEYQVKHSNEEDILIFSIE
jgi:hypothetical protein